MKKGLPAFYLVLFLLASCNSNWEKSTEDYTIKTFTFEDIPETVKLEGKKVRFPGAVEPQVHPLGGGLSGGGGKGILHDAAPD